MSEVWMHGWSLSSSFFQEMAHGSGTKPLLADHGYFGSPRFPTSPPTKLVIHSLGLHLIPLAWFATVEELILLGSFLSFHSPTQPSSRKAVSRMIKKMESEPAHVLTDFWANSQAPAPCTWDVPATLDQALLIQDLQLLDHVALDPALLQGIPRVLILHGEQDAIVPLERAQHLQAALPQADFQTLPAAGHGFPASHPQATWAAIAKWRGHV